MEREKTFLTAHSLSPLPSTAVSRTSCAMLVAISVALALRMEMDPRADEAWRSPPRLALGHVCLRQVDDKKELLGLHFFAIMMAQFLLLVLGNSQRLLQ